MKRSGREESGPKAGFYETPVFLPGTSGQRKAFISVQKANHFANFGPVHKYGELKSLVRETLVDPHRVYAYNAQEFDGYCYVRAAKHSCTNRGITVSPPTGMVFVVFVASSLKVMDWGWEYHSRDDALEPLISEGRLEKRLWPKDD